MEKKVRKDFQERLLRVKILSHKGDKLHLKLPISFVKKLIKNNGFDFFYNIDEIVDSKKLLNIVTKALDEDICGEVAHIETKNRDIIKIILD